ncbi:hypothetical protein [Okeania sp. KiyG1]|nr:hypothetical protein [Okeania sp. KiyG1]
MILALAPPEEARRKGTPSKKAAGGAVSAPVAHGGSPQDRAGLSVERL